jgi:hypothetical protein
MRKILLSGLLTLPWQLLAQQQMCETTLQISHYQPQSCYYQYQQAQCQDVCSTADPEFNPSCFKQLALPCSLKTELLATAPGRQQRYPYRWVHLADLLAYPQLISELHLFQSALYAELYHEFVKAPAEVGFSPASDELKKENFRLSALTGLSAMTDPLRYAGLYRRYSLGKALESSFQHNLLYLKSQIDRYPYYQNAERLQLRTELDSLANNQLRFWQLTAASSLDAVLSSRIKQLNQRLEKYADTIRKLSPAHQQLLLAKSAVLEPFHPAAIQPCHNTICVNAIVKDSQDLLAQDGRLNQFEKLLTMLSNEALVLLQAYNDNYQPKDPTALTRPDFAGFVQKQWQSYLSAPSDTALQKLGTAINVAFTVQNVSGAEVFASLAATATETVQGFSTLAAYQQQPVLLCQQQRSIAPELQQIQQQMHQLAGEGRSIIRLMLKQGHSAELLSRLQEVMARISQLVARSNAIATVDQFNTDRNIHISWDLQSAAAGSLSTAATTVAIEYLEYDGMFWLPSMSATVQQLIPTITDISTLHGSLLPAAIGPGSPMHELDLVIRQTPYSGCQPGNKELKLVVRITDPTGDSQRKVLIAQLEQL